MNTSRRRFLLGGSAALFLEGVHSSAFGELVEDGFSPVKIGGGGYVTSIDISADGTTHVVRTDTFSGYRWDAAASRWDVFARAGRMPPTDIGIDRASGVFEVRVAPSDAKVVYQYKHFIHRSNDGGVTWTRTRFPGVDSNPNIPSYRLVGPKMAIHPTDPNVVYFGTEKNGVFYTLDGGTSWTRERSIPNALPGPNGFSGTHIVNFSRDGTKVYVSSYGNGLYRSDTLGGSFSLVPGGPAAGGRFWMVKVAVDSLLYVTIDPTVNANVGQIWRYDDSRSVWTNITPASPARARWQTIACDSKNPARILVGDSGGGLAFNTDRGASSSWSAIVPKVNAASDIPWLAHDTYLSEGDIVFDPIVPNRLWLAWGAGVSYADIGSKVPASVKWISQTTGIEQLVANSIVCTPSGNLIAASWDRAIFKLDRMHLDTFPKSQTYDRSVQINHCWHVDWASTDPDFIVALVDKSQGRNGPALSIDGGSTWRQWPSVPSSSAVPFFGGYGGSIAVSTPANWIWNPWEDNDLWQTKDGGSSWNKVVIPGVPTANGKNETGWGHRGGIGSQRHIAVAADRVIPGTFYAMNNGTAKDLSFAGIYRSTDGGDTWKRVYAGNLTSYVRDFWSSKLKAVPKIGSSDTAGHLFYTCGRVGGEPNPDRGAPFKFSSNGGATWVNASGVFEVYAFGFGAPAPNKDYAAVFIAGWVNGSYGIWRADSNAADWEANTVRWTKMAMYPFGWTDTVTTIDGDKSIHGRVYIGFIGSGYAYGNR